jgi:hypothetical protein
MPKDVGYYVPGKGSGGNGSKHMGQSVENSGGQGSPTKGPVSYPSSAMSMPADTAKPTDGSKKSPKIFG